MYILVHCPNAAYIEIHTVVDTLRLTPFVTEYNNTSFIALSITMLAAASVRVGGGGEGG